MLLGIPGGAVAHEFIDLIEGVNKMTPLFAVDEQMFVKVLMSVLVVEHDFLLRQLSARVNALIYMFIIERDFFLR